MVGKFKDEARGQSINEFVGLTTKMNSYQIVKTGVGIRTLNDPSHGQAWFTRKSGQRAFKAGANFLHEQFKAQLDHPEETYVLNRRIGSKLHQFYGIEVWT